MGLSLEALDAVGWKSLEINSSLHPVTAVPQALRRLALAGPYASENDCDLLHYLAADPGEPAPSAAPAALPFVLALASDPAMGVRPALVEVLVSLLRAPELAQQYDAAALPLLADPDPAVRQAAIELAGGRIDLLLERWRAETETRVRVALLLALGKTLTDAAGADRVREVLAQVLAGDDPVLWTAAVHASADLDPELPLRHLDRLLEVHCDLAQRPRFEVDLDFAHRLNGPWTWEHMLWWTYRRLEHRPDLQLAFPFRLLAVAESDDTAMCREALDMAWHRVVGTRRPVPPELLPTAGRLLDHPDPGIRLRAVNLLAAFGPAAATHADRLVALLDDDGTEKCLDGTVGALARWALTRIGDRRGLPGLVEQLQAQAEESDRSYDCATLRRPAVVHVLAPLHGHAGVLLPQVREVLRRHPAGAATEALLAVLEAWGPHAAPALPELLSLLDDPRVGSSAIAVLLAIGPAAAPALRARRLTPAQLGWDPDLIADDREAALRLIGEAVLTADPWWYGPVGRLGEFGPTAAGYADHLRRGIASTDHLLCLDAAAALWSITGRPGPGLEVLAGPVVQVADGGDRFFLLSVALRLLVRMGAIDPAIRAALLTLRRSGRRLSSAYGYEAVLDDEQHRALIDRALACPDAVS